MAKKPVKKISMKEWEDSTADRAKDRREARKRGISVEKYEGSKADMKADKDAVRKANSKRK